MTAIEDRMVPRALAMIARHGVSATYANYISSEMTVEGDIEVDEDGDGLNEETDYTVTVSLPVPVDEVRSDAPTVQESVTFLAGSGLTFTPSAGDTLTIEDKLWTISEVRRFGSIATPIAYRLTLRGGES